MSPAKAASFPKAVCYVGLRKLDYMNAAKKLDDLKAPSGNRLEALKGDYKGKHSIRINDQYG
jgi:proteic killer suppression protein